jgi:hypothetical protein
MVMFDEFIAIGLALPGAVEKPTWEDTITLRVNDKIFAMGSVDAQTISVKASREEQIELIADDPETYAAAPYVGRFGWLSVTLARVDRDELDGLMTEAWRRTAPKRLVRQYDASVPAASERDREP